MTVDRRVVLIFCTSLHPLDSTEMVLLYFSAQTSTGRRVSNSVVTLVSMHVSISFEYLLSLTISLLA